MKTNALLLLSFGALLAAACDSGNQRSAPATTAEAPSVAEASSAELNADSVSNANLAAVAHQPQMDTSVTKLGTEATGGIVAKGAALITASDCTTCHKEQEKLIGPAYVAVAEKYPDTEANITMLAGKIIKGGKGNWGDIPMTAHPQVSVADAKEMTRYILSLK